MRTHAFEPESAGGISGAVIAFAQYARANGLNVGVQEVLDALAAAREGTIDRRSTFRYALRSLFCCRQEELARFDQLFDRFWNTPGHGGRSSRRIVDPAGVIRKSQASLVMMGTGKTGGEEEEGKNVSGANAIERLRRTDFARVAAIDSELLEEIARRLWREMSLRLKRRWRRSRRSGPVDLRRTIRRSIGHGGDPIELVRRRRQPRRQRLVVLLDVSGSMDKYSFFLLRFVCALQEHFRQVEAFTFSTHLQRITEFLRQRGLTATLRMLSERADSWSSGTKIGECLRTFNETYAKRTLAGNSLVIVLSDGLDTGEPGVLAEEMEKIARRARRVVWLNPLKGMSGYAPTARGMSEALPHVHDFGAAHNLDSLLELENLLSHV